MPELMREPKDLKLAALVASEAEDEATTAIQQIARQRAGVMPPQSPQPQGVKL